MYVTIRANIMLYTTVESSNMIERKVAQTVRPTSGSMNLDTGKVSGKEAFVMAGFSLASILVMAIGGILVVWASPKNDYDLNAYRIIGMVTGALISLCGLRFAWSMSSLMLHSWHSYHQRLADWHNAELDMYLAQNGVETVTEVSQLELTPQLCKDVLITALHIQQQLDRNDRFTHAPWSVRGLEAPLYLNGDHNSILLGKLTGTRPELMSETLAQLGLVKGRKPGFEGTWAVESIADIYIVLGRNWNKRRS